jgi:hypothetical protein
MYSLGYEYAQKLHSDGKFDQYHLAEVLLSGDDGGLQVRAYVVVCGAAGTDQQHMQCSPCAGSCLALSTFCTVTICTGLRANAFLMAPPELHSCSEV